MGIDMKAFMKPELKDRGTMEFPGIERYKDAKGNVIPFIIKRLSMKEIKEIRNNYKTKEVYRDKRNGDRPIIGNNGQVAVINDYDGDSAGLEIMVEAFVQPKLDDPELMEYYGVHDRLDMPNIIFPDKLLNASAVTARECISVPMINFAANRNTLQKIPTTLARIPYRVRTSVDSVFSLSLTNLRTKKSVIPS